MRTHNRSIHPRQLIIIGVVLALLVMLSIGVVSRYVTAGGSAPAAPAANVVVPAAGTSSGRVAAPAAPGAAWARVVEPAFDGTSGLEEAAHAAGSKYQVQKDGTLTIR